VLRETPKNFLSHAPRVALSLSGRRDDQRYLVPHTLGRSDSSTSSQRVFHSRFNFDGPVETANFARPANGVPGSAARVHVLIGTACHCGHGPSAAMRAFSSSLNEPQAVL
jgi:hypothetical protein